ncbi:hypothetical protein, partial [Pseudomonas sp.]|uniref:hypothetical protein n=1 Tax=Pseudomonas sp. TaxID=306 RepID=UPI00257EB069
TVSGLEVDDQTVSTTVEELARLKKVIAFVDRIIASFDLELTPKSIWGNCHNQTESCRQQVQAYASTRKPGHLAQANDHADNLLTYIRPYMIPPEQALEAYGEAVHQFSNVISGYVGSFQARASNAKAEILSLAEKSRQQQNEIEAIELKAKQFDEFLFVGVEGNMPADLYIKQMIQDVEAKHEAVGALYKSLLEGAESTSAKVTTWADDIREKRDSLKNLLDSAKSETRELEVFHQRIFGSRKAEDDTNEAWGLEHELDQRLTQLQSYELEQQKRQNALFVSIESLLPGATSAGLASAYKNLKDHFRIPIQKYTTAFNFSMLLLLLGGFALVVDSFTLWPMQIEFVKAIGWEELLRSLLMRLPIILPIIWFAIFSATRRSQYERLQQEYAHKEALAASYEGYKKQLKELNVDADDLQKELIAKAIDAISFNASKTLDGNHTEKLPAHHFIESLTAEIKKMIGSTNKL